MTKKIICLFMALMCVFLYLPQISAIESSETTSESLILGSEKLDFVVNVENGRMPRIMVISDTQIIESEQMRNPDRLAEWQQIIWSKTKKEENCYGYVRKAVKEYDPDLIIIPGDFVYGQFDDSGEAFIDEIKFFDSLKTPWAPVFGNHDNESQKGVDWQCEQFEQSEYCLFKQRTLTGNGNYTIGIVQDGKLKRVFVMLDSNGCGGVSAESLANGHTTSNIGFGNDQIEWYTETLNAIKEKSPSTKFTAVFHIQLSVMNDAIAKYGEVPLNLYEIGKNGDYGYINAPTKLAWDSDKSVYNGMRALGVDSFINGHEHWNNGGIFYDGVRFIYGLKSSTYDRYNSITSTGEVVTGGGVAPYLGGTAIDLTSDGSICNIYHVVSSVDNQTSGAKTVTYDFNGKDFDATVNIPNFTQHTAISAIDPAIVPFGYSEGVYQELCDASDSLTAVGLKFGGELEFDNIQSFKVRMYVTDYTPIKEPLLRTYYDTINATQTSAPFESCGGVIGRWCEVEIKDLISKYVKDGKLEDFVLVYRYYSNGTEKPMCFFDSVKITYTEKPEIKTFDFDGKDFDATVNIPNFTQHTATLAAEISSVPAGYSGAVYEELCDAADSLTAVGLKFGEKFEFEKIQSFKVRMYVTDYTPIKEPLLRTYYDTINATQTSAPFESCGGVIGQWCEVEIKDLISKYMKDGKLEDFVLVYRYYSNGTEKPKCYFDSVTIAYTPKAVTDRISFVGAQIRTSGVQGLRFVFEMDYDLYSMLSESERPKSYEDTGIGFGTVLLPKRMLGNQTLTKETEDAVIVPAVRLYTHPTDVVTYTACLTHTPVGEYTEEYVAVPYITYIENGVEKTLYGIQTENVSIFNVAKLAFEDETTSQLEKNYYYENIITAVMPGYGVVITIGKSVGDNNISVSW